MESGVIGGRGLEKKVIPSKKKGAEIGGKSKGGENGRWTNLQLNGCFPLSVQTTGWTQTRKKGGRGRIKKKPSYIRHLSKRKRGRRVLGWVRS